jgi:hypothetical protein
MISPIVDEVWHAFILFTSDYAAFCDEVFGRFVHHAPNWPGGGDCTTDCTSDCEESGIGN